MEENLSVGINKEALEQLNVIRCIYDKIVAYNNSFVLAESDKKEHIIKYDGSEIPLDTKCRYKVLYGNNLAIIHPAIDKDETDIELLNGMTNKVYKFSVELYSGRVFSNDYILSLSGDIVIIKGYSNTIIANTLKGDYSNIPASVSSIQSIKSNSQGQLLFCSTYNRTIGPNDTLRMTVYTSTAKVMQAEVGSQGLICYDRKYIGKYCFIGKSLDYKQYAAYANRGYSIGSEKQSEFVPGVKYRMIDENGMMGDTEYDGFDLYTREVNLLQRKYFICYNMSKVKCYSKYGNRIDRLYGITDIHGNAVIQAKYTAIHILNNNLAVLVDNLSDMTTIIDLDNRKIIEYLPCNNCAVHPVFNIVTVYTRTEAVPDGEYIIYESASKHYPLSSFLYKHKAYSCSQYPNIYKIEATDIYRLQYSPICCTFIDNRMNVISNGVMIKELSKAKWDKVKYE